MYERYGIEWGRGNLAFLPHATQVSPTNGEAANLCLDVEFVPNLGKMIRSK